MSIEDIDPEFLSIALLVLAFMFGALMGATLTIVAYTMSARRDHHADAPAPNTAIEDR